MTAIALFGKNTYFDIAAQAWNSSANENSNMLSGERICNVVPFARLEPRTWDELHTDSDTRFPGCDPRTETEPEQLHARQFLSKWLHGFNNTGIALTALSSAVFLANRAVVTTDQFISRYRIGSSSRDGYGRSIYSGYGTTISKPQLSLSVVIGMNSILALELLRLAILA